MTTPEQFLTDAGDLIATVLLLIIPIVAAAFWLERRARRRREPEVLPPPVDGRDHNAESIAEWRRKYERLDVDEIHSNQRAP